MNRTHLIEDLVACREHMGTNSSPDRRSKMAYTNQDFLRGLQHLHLHSQGRVEELLTYFNSQSKKDHFFERQIEQLLRKRGFFFY